MTRNACGVCLGNLNCLQGLHPVISCGIVECCSVGGKEVEKGLTELRDVFLLSNSYR